MKKVWNSIKDYVYIVLAVLIIRTYIVTPAIVDGDSMNNTLLDGQIVILNKITYRFNDVNRFDIVVIENREDNDKIIKRIIGLPNEKIRYIDNKLYINDKLIETNLSLKTQKILNMKLRMMNILFLEIIELYLKIVEYWVILKRGYSW